MRPVLPCLLPFFALAVACSSSSSGPSASGDDADPAAPTTIADDLGKSCSAGCDKDLCIVTGYPGCSTGDCLLDARAGLASIDTYCTSDCRAVACPDGYSCEDVPSALTGSALRRCTKIPGSPADAGADDGVDADAAPPKVAALSACTLTMSGCASVCGDLGKTCSTKCSAFAGAQGAVYASESTCKALGAAVDPINECKGGRASVADWVRCCCE